MDKIIRSPADGKRLEIATILRQNERGGLLSRRERAASAAADALLQPPRPSAAANALLSRRERAERARGYDASRRRCASGSASSFLSVWFSICRIRSRVTLNARPTSSSV